MDTQKAQRQGKGRGIGTAERLRRALAEYNYELIQDLSDRSGVPFHTIRKIKSGETKDPHCSAADALLHGLSSEPHKRLRRQVLPEIRRRATAA